MIRCLIVTADKTVRDTVKVGLDQTQAFEVECAEDAWALEMVRASPYQVVVADSTLGDGSDGIELLRRVRDVSADAELLLVTRSKTQNRYLTRDKQQLGIYAFLQAPIEPFEFFKVVARLLERLGTSVEA